MKIRIRYSRDENRIPKNTLATIRDGSIIYYGISRCNTKLDKFDKQEGAERATIRVRTAFDLLSGLESTKNSELAGCVHEDDIKDLLEYFNNIN